ncbi:MAG: hypothetical protein JSV62_15335 [Promethearchaeota archaeon]|nr:MAG: hypothetical protein JSV62_15335 [Candidatus Lokiarchaeota archaeon]
MESGKITSLVAGILTILATYVFSWYTMNIPPNIPPTFYSNGLGIITNLPNMFTNAETLGIILGIPGFAIYIIAGFLIYFLASGIIQIIGIKSRTAVLVGSIMPIGIGIALLFASGDILDRELWIGGVFGTNHPLGIFPLQILPDNIVDIGGYLLLVGGGLGIISAFLPRE